jgi:two-component system, OmpR family, sensor histidine kinase ResE
MIRNSIVAKLWLTIVCMVVVVLALLSILLQQFFDNYLYQQQSQQLVRLAQSVQMLVKEAEGEGENPVFAFQVAQKLADIQNANTKVQMATPLASNPTLQQAYRHFTKAERKRFAAGSAITVRGSMGAIDSDTGSVTVYMSLPTQTTGVSMVGVTQQTSALNEPITLIRNLIIFSVALGILLTTGLAFVLSKNISRPLIEMNEAAERMARGDFKARVNVITKDEVGKLGSTFNSVASELDRTIVALQLEKEQLSSILASLNDGVIAADLNGEVTLLNPPAARRLVPILYSETGQSELKMLPQDLHALMTTVVSRVAPVTREMTWNGREISVTMTPLYESNGQTLRGVVSVQRDVTEERRLDRLRKDFIANVSHELRTPLSMMQGYTEALLDEFGDDPVQRKELTEIIHDETLRMKRLVNDLLNLAQLESGYFPLSLEPLELTDVLRKVARKFSTLASEQSVSLVSDVPEASVVVNGDGDRLEQVFTNLIDNAIRHTGTGGSVCIALLSRPERAEVRISDTGSGIPAEDLPYIWERFYKADKARTRGRSGTGLGLAITRHIVLEHGGDILVESRMSVGTTFRVLLPLVSTSN